MGRTMLEVGDVLVSHPCRVRISFIVGTSAWGECDRCGRAKHVLDVPLFESGRGPWRRSAPHTAERKA